jgi:hypothetical protein
MEKERINYWYPLKVWLTTIILVSPVLFLIAIRLISGDWNFDILIHPRLILQFITYGLVFSLPTLAVCYTSFISLARKQFSPLVLKSGLILMVVLGVLLTLQLTLHYIENIFVFVYTIAAVISSLIFKVYMPIKESND